MRSGLLPASGASWSVQRIPGWGRHDRRGQAARGQSLWHSWPGTRAAMDSAASPTLMPRRWRSFGGTCSAENPPAPAARRHLGVGNLQRQGTLSRPSSGREHLFEIAGGGAAVQFIFSNEIAGCGARSNSFFSNEIAGGGAAVQFIFRNEIAGCGAAVQGRPRRLDSLARALNVGRDLTIRRIDDDGCSNLPTDLGVSR